MACNGSGALLYFLVSPEARMKRKVLSLSNFRTVVGFRYRVSLLGARALHAPPPSPSPSSDSPQLV
jgi:hypothetical protein